MSEVIAYAKKCLSFWRKLVAGTEELHKGARALDIHAMIDMVDGLLAEIEGSRLTDQEREAVEAAVDRFEDSINGTDDPERSAALRGLLERLG